MLSLEEAIHNIETEVSGDLNKVFPNSKLRENPDSVARYLQAQIKVASDFPDLNQAQEIIAHVVQGAWEKPKSLDLQYITDMCEIIILCVSEKEDQDGMSIEDLNDHFCNKYLYFNGDEDGEEILYVENIHKDICRDHKKICVDGVIINLDHQEQSVNIYTVRNHSFSWFYYFEPDKDDGEWTKAKELYEGLLSRPIDTNLETHVMSPAAVSDCIKSFISATLEDFDISDIEL